MQRPSARSPVPPALSASLPTPIGRAASSGASTSPVSLEIARALRLLPELPTPAAAGRALTQPSPSSGREAAAPSAPSQPLPGQHQHDARHAVAAVPSTQEAAGQSPTPRPQPLHATCRQQRRADAESQTETDGPSASRPSPAPASPDAAATLLTALSERDAAVAELESLQSRMHAARSAVEQASVSWRERERMWRTRAETAEAALQRLARSAADERDQAAPRASPHQASASRGAMAPQWRGVADEEWSLDPAMAAGASGGGGPGEGPAGDGEQRGHSPAWKISMQHLPPVPRRPALGAQTEPSLSPGPDRPVAPASPPSISTVGTPIPAPAPLPAGERSATSGAPPASSPAALPGVARVAGLGPVGPGRGGPPLGASAEGDGSGESESGSWTEYGDSSQHSDTDKREGGPVAAHDRAASPSSSCGSFSSSRDELLPTIDETLGPETTLLRDDNEGAGHVLASSGDHAGTRPRQATLGSQSESSWEETLEGVPTGLPRDRDQADALPGSEVCPVASVQSWDDADADSFEARLGGGAAAPSPATAQPGASVIAGQVAALRARLRE